MAGCLSAKEPTGCSCCWFTTSRLGRTLGGPGPPASWAPPSSTEGGKSAPSHLATVALLFLILVAFVRYMVSGKFRWRASGKSKWHVSGKTKLCRSVNLKPSLSVRPQSASVWKTLLRVCPEKPALFRCFANRLGLCSCPAVNYPVLKLPRR